MPYLKNKFLKSIAAILFTFLFGLHIAGYLIIFAVERDQAYRDMKNSIEKGIPDSRLTKIIISSEESSELNWFEENEFSYKGEMFDVVKKCSSSNGDIIYYCINDSRETNLFNFLKKNIDSNQNKNSKSHTLQIAAKILPIYQTTYAPHLGTLKMIDKSYNLFYFDFYKSPFLKIVAPPPKLLSHSSLLIPEQSAVLI